MLAFFTVLAIVAVVLNFAYGAWMLLTKREAYLVVPIAALFMTLALGCLVALLYRTAPTIQSAFFYVKLYFTVAAIGTGLAFETAMMLPLTPTAKWMHLLVLPLFFFVGKRWTTSLGQVVLVKSKAGWEVTRADAWWMVPGVYMYLLAALALVILYSFYKAQTDHRLKHAAKWFLIGGVIFMVTSIAYYTSPIYYSFPDPLPLVSLLSLIAIVWGLGALGEPKLVKVALSQTLLDVSPDLIFVTSPEREILYFNKAVERYIPKVSGANRVDDLVVFGPGFDPDRPKQEVQVADRVILVESISLTDRWGQPGYLIIGRDITETKRLMEKLKALSITDPLTGLFNRRYLAMKLEQEAALAKKQGTDFVVFMVDLDNFKSVNDGIGHQAGDFVLKQVASIMKGQLRDTDTLARYGGDEFAGILAIDDLERGRKVLQRVLNTVSGTEFSWDGRKIRIGFSAGLTSFRCAGGRAESLLSTADMALYDAKSSGKGNVSVKCPRDVKN